MSQLTLAVRTAMPRPTQDPARGMGKWKWSEPTQREIEAGQVALDELVERYGRLEEQLNAARAALDRGAADYVGLLEQFGTVRDALIDHLQTHNGAPGDPLPLCMCESCVLGRSALSFPARES